MIANGHDDLDRALSRFRDEVLRWNGSFNLISRIDTESRLESLIDESVESFGVMRDEVLGGSCPVLQDGPKRIQYVDLGSGAGFPGLLWHLLWEQAGIPGSDHAGSLLVEPRDKRAWFLEHTASLLGLKDLEVGLDQWGRRTGLRSSDDSERIMGLVVFDDALREKYHLPETSAAQGGAYSSIVPFKVASKPHAFLLSIYPCI